MLGNSLCGLRVADFTQVAAGPLCTQILADLGATVTKIEGRDGELCRTLAPFIEGQSVGFLALNGNKRSVAMDLKDPEQAQAALRLAANADVVVESFRPGVMSRLGLGYEEVARCNPQVIYCSISAYGQEGPWRHKPGVDGALQAVSGLMSVTGTAGAPPSKVQVPLVDMVTGYLSSVAILAALAKRESESVGEWIDMSMFNSAVAVQQMAFAAYLAEDIVPIRIGSAAPYAAPNEALQCADGWIMVAAYQPERWSALCRVLEVSELEADPRFHDLTERIANRRELVHLLEQRLMRRPKAEWLQQLEAADIICAPINDYSEVVKSPPFQSPGMIDCVRHPTAGAVRLTRTPLQAVGETPLPRRPAPLVGEHDDEVLQEIGIPEERRQRWSARAERRGSGKQEEQ